MHDTVDWDEQKRALKGKIDEMRRQHREEHLASRLAIKNQFDDMKLLGKEERLECKKSFQPRLDEIKRLHCEQQAQRKALEDQLEEINRLQNEGRIERKKTLREQIVEKVERARDEHIEKHHTPRAPEFRQIQGDPELRKGFLKQHIVLALSIRPAHGYELIHWISHHTGHAWTPSPGSMYPALESLESKGIIACQGDGRRKVYSLTSKGEDVVAQMTKKREEQFFEMKAFMSALFDE